MYVPQMLLQFQPQWTDTQHNTIDYIKHFIMQTLYINIFNIFIITTSSN